MYYSRFYSQLRYGCLDWSHLQQSNIDPVKKLQKYYVRFTFLSDLNAHTNGLSFELKLLKITGILEIQKVILMFNSITNDIFEAFKRVSMITVYIYYYEAHSSQIFHIMKKRSSKFGIHTLT